MPELSVLLCVRDGAATIDAAVRSTLRAMPRDAELVVLDDGSTDATLDVLARFDDARLRVTTAPEPLGPAGARKRLVETTDSRYFATMDADDLAAPWRFRVQRALAGRADLQFGQVLAFSHGVRSWRPGLPVTIGPAAMPLMLLIGNNLYHPTLFAHRDAVERVGGYRVCVMEDYELWMRAAAGGLRLLRWGGPVLAYRDHPGQVSKGEGFVARAVAEGIVGPTRERLAREVFGVEVDGIERADLWPLVRREVDARTRTRLEREALLRHATARLGPEQALSEVA